MSKLFMYLYAEANGYEYDKKGNRIKLEVK